ncbi:MAG: hypothetical protein HQ561_12030 [Desulfobacteraceae bacterium]|nr:hypothetical protein [Desulfobacteraceae bacterium]
MQGAGGKGVTVDDTKGFLKAYHDFRDAVDLTKSGFLPSRDDLIWYMLMGVPRVPADDDPGEDSAIVAIDQRVNILKAVFVETNKNQPDDFLDQGLAIYDQAGERAKTLLEEGD